MHYLVYAVEAYDIEETLAPFEGTKLDYFEIGGRWHGALKFEDKVDEEKYDFEMIDYWEDEDGDWCANHIFMGDINLEYMLMPEAIITHDGRWLEDEDEINEYIETIHENYLVSVVDIHN